MLCGAGARDPRRMRPVMSVTATPRAPAGSRRRSPHRKPVHGAEDRHPDRFEVAHDPLVNASLEEHVLPWLDGGLCRGARAPRLGTRRREFRNCCVTTISEQWSGAPWSSDQRARAWSAARRWSIGRLIVAPRISLSDEQPVFACRSLVGARPRMPGCRPTGFARRRRGSSPRRQS